MALQHDSQGFLVGDPLSVQALIDEWKKSDAKIGAIQATLTKIEGLLKNGLPAKKAETVRRRTDSTASNITRRKPAAETPPRRRTRREEGADDAPVGGRRTARSGSPAPSGDNEKKVQDQAPAKRQANVPASPRAKTPGEEKAPQIQQGAQTKAAEPVRAGTTAEGDPAARGEKQKRRRAQTAEPAKRDARGRFTKNGESDEESATQRSLEDTKLGRFATRIAEAVSQEAQQAGEADPAVQAVQEVAEPLARGFEVFGAFTDDDDKEDIGWFKRIFSAVKGIREDNSAYQKAEDRRLKAIEASTEKAAVAKGGSGGGFLSSLFGAGAGGLFAKLGAGLGIVAKRIPLVGAALAGAKGIFDVWASETNDDLTRDEKNRRTGAGVGGAAGSIGMGFMGAKAGSMAGGALGSFLGPIGTAVGASLGGILGGVAGLISGGEVGKEIGSWGGDLVSLFSGLPNRIEDAWNGLTETVSEKFSSAIDSVSEFFGFDKIGEKLSAAGEKISGAWDSVKAFFSEKPDGEAEKLLKNPYDVRGDGENWHYFEMHRLAYQSEGKTPEEASNLAKARMDEARATGKTREESFSAAHPDMDTGRLIEIETQVDAMERHERRLGAAESVKPTPAAQKTAEATPGESPGGWSLGQTSAQFESGGRGAGTISRGRGDHGGASYGTYQLSSKTGTLDRFLKESGYASQFEGMKVDSIGFNRKWRELAENDPNFGKAQHDFIKQTHFDPAMAALKNAGIDLYGRGAAVQDMVWSTANQFGAGSARRGSGGAGLIRKAIGKRNVAEMSDQEIIEAVQNYKLQENDKLFRSSSAAVRRGTARRAEAEKQSLLALANQEGLATAQASAALRAPLSEENPATKTAAASQESSPVTESMAASIRSPALASLAAASPKGGTATQTAAASQASKEAMEAKAAERRAALGILEPTSPDAGSTTKTAVASAPSSPVAASMAASLRTPAVATVAAASPAMPPIQTPPPAPAQPVETPVTGARPQGQTVVRVEGDVGQDMKERGIAHIATGGMV